MTDIASALTGEFRSPRNLFQHVAGTTAGAGSIHNDAVASKLGFKGGTVPGSVHMNQFVPLILKIYGETWFEHGDMSAFFTQATVDNEATRPTAEPGDERARLRLYNEPGDLICEATASLNPPDPSAELVRRMAMQNPAEPGRLRILADLKVGDEQSDIPLRLDREMLLRTLETITEDIPAYRERNVLPPGVVVHLAHGVRSVVLGQQRKAVGLFGALEIRHLDGPFHADVDYVARTTILKLSESPRTENVWYDVHVADAKTSQDVGVVRFLIRLMKGSSPLWAEELKAKSA
ncbi:MAG TPA: hypothetical protein VE309_01425 [Caulobacteraceae bacterium]|nr:hypothetical protein [Caulobacteraceae bacterium]